MKTKSVQPNRLRPADVDFTKMSRGEVEEYLAGVDWARLGGDETAELLDKYRALDENEADRIIDRDFKEGKFDAMSYAELEEYIEEVRARTGCEPHDDAWDLEIARDAKLGRLDDLFEEARRDIREGRVLPVPGEFGDKWERKISRDAAAGKFDEMSAEEIQAYIADIRAKDEQERGKLKGGKVRDAGGKHCTSVKFRKMLHDLPEDVQAEAGSGFQVLQ